MSDINVLDIPKPYTVGYKRHFWLFPYYYVDFEGTQLTPPMEKKEVQKMVDLMNGAYLNGASWERLATLIETDEKARDTLVNAVKEIREENGTC